MAQGREGKAGRALSQQNSVYVFGIAAVYFCVPERKCLGNKICIEMINIP